MKKRLLVLLLIPIFIMTSILPASATAKNVFLKNASAGKKIALTFDDGPHPIYTPKILDILESYNVKATFFVIGQNVDNYPEAAKRLLDSGCEIGNHTYRHRNVAAMSEDELRAELERTESAIASLSGTSPSLLRPPEGSYGSLLERISLEKGYDVILWSIDTRDWEYASAEQICKKVLTNVEGGDIILMHDYTSHGAHTCEALVTLIPELLNMGYELVTVSELIYGE